MTNDSGLISLIARTNKLTSIGYLYVVCHVHHVPQVTNIHRIRSNSIYFDEDIFFDQVLLSF